jgi:hypothetical protein
MGVKLSALLSFDAIHIGYSSDTYRIAITLVLLSALESSESPSKFCVPSVGDSEASESRAVSSRCSSAQLLGRLTDVRPHRLPL